MSRTETAPAEAPSGQASDVKLEVVGWRADAGFSIGDALPDEERPT